MVQSIGYVTIVVREYDEAIAWYTDVLGFDLVEDTPLTPGKRWVLVAPPGSRGTQLLLARAASEAQSAAIGNQAGGRVGFFLHTDAIARDSMSMMRRGVVFEEAPREDAYGTVAVFRDLYGNRWDLLQLRGRGIG